MSGATMEEISDRWGTMPTGGSRCRPMMLFYSRRMKNRNTPAIAFSANAAGG
jgi:hypothetical protein